MLVRLVTRKMISFLIGWPKLALHAKLSLIYINCSRMSPVEKHPHFFGYGSLVNRNTHDFTPIHVARITGWRRVWHRAPIRPAAFLSVVPDTSSVIEGVIAPVPNDDWAALDKRETAYDRIDVTDGVGHGADNVRDVSIYAIPSGSPAPPNAEHPILLSYVDTVLQGYLLEFGEDGAKDFVTTTEGWEYPVMDDRAAPVYPRAQALSDDERGFVNDLLSLARARVVKV